MVALVGCLVALLVFPFITVPSIIYGISGYVLLPLGFFLILFTGRPSGIQASLIAFRLIPIFLIIVIPILLYFYVWEPLGWIFFAWMLIYFLSRFYTGVHKKEVTMIHAWKEFAAFTEQNVQGYIRNNYKIIAIIAVLTIISILAGYLLGGLTGLRIGIFAAILNWWLTPYARETLVEIKSGRDKGTETQEKLKELKNKQVKS